MPAVAAFLLNPRVLITLAILGLLAWSHITVYRKGETNVRNEWTVSTASANAEARTLEQQRQRRADEAGRLGAAREAGFRADAARADLVVGGMRNTLDAVERASQESHAAATRSVAALRTVYDACVAEYRVVGQDAALHSSDSLKLQQAWPK